MLSHEMAKLLTFTKERQSTLRQEAAVAQLLSQQEKPKKHTATWPQALRRWWRRMTPIRPVCQTNHHSLAES